MFSKVLVSLFVLEQLFGSSIAKDFKGKCPSPKLQENFNLSSYTGFWYEQYRDPSFFWEKNGDCSTAEYVPNTDGTIKVINSQVVQGKSAVDSMTGKAKCTEGTADCQVSFFADFYGPYDVISTDYDKYTIVYSCSNDFFGPNHSSHLWVLSRDQTPLDEATLESVKEILAREVAEWALTDMYAPKQGGDCKYATPTL